MKKGIILLRPIRWISGTESTIEEKIYACGLNTGNIVWYEAAKESIQFDYELFGNGELKKKCEEYDEAVIVSPMANDINLLSTAVEKRAELICRESDRIVLIGIGAQLTEEANTPRKLMDMLPKERVKALQKLGEHSVSIGVRGEITAECLDIIGVHNYKIIGCPSFYSRPDKIRGGVFERKYVKDIRVNINLNAYGHIGISRLLNLLAAEGKLQDSTYIMQAMEDFPKTIYENMPILERHMRERFPQVQISAEDFTQFVRNNGKIFFDQNEWFSFLENENITFSVGARFHGNMMSLLAGIPSLWITHDSRTVELCRAMGLSYIDVDKMNEIHCLDELFSYCNYGEEFKRGYQEKLNYYIQFLNENGLTYIK